MTKTEQGEGSTCKTVGKTLETFKEWKEASVAKECMRPSVIWDESGKQNM